MIHNAAGDVALLGPAGGTKISERGEKTADIQTLHARVKVSGDDVSYAMLKMAACAFSEETDTIKRDDRQCKNRAGTQNETQL